MAAGLLGFHVLHEFMGIGECIWRLPVLLLDDSNTEYIQLEYLMDRKYTGLSPMRRHCFRRTNLRQRSSTPPDHLWDFYGRVWHDDD